MHSSWLWWYNPKFQHTNLTWTPCLEYRIRASFKLEFVSRALKVWLSRSYDASQSNVSRSSVHNHKLELRLYSWSSQPLPSDALWIAEAWSADFISGHAER